LFTCPCLIAGSVRPLPGYEGVVGSKLSQTHRRLRQQSSCASRRSSPPRESRWCGLERGHGRRMSRSSGEVYIPLCSSGRNGLEGPFQPGRNGLGRKEPRGRTEPVSHSNMPWSSSRTPATHMCEMKSKVIAFQPPVGSSVRGRLMVTGSSNACNAVPDAAGNPREAGDQGYGVDHKSCLCPARLFREKLSYPLQGEGEGFLPKRAFQSASVSNVWRYRVNPKLSGARNLGRGMKRESSFYGAVDLVAAIQKALDSIRVALPNACCGLLVLGGGIFRFPENMRSRLPTRGRREQQSPLKGVW